MKEYLLNRNLHVSKTRMSSAQQILSSWNKAGQNRPTDLNTPLHTDGQPAFKPLPFKETK